MQSLGLDVVTASTGDAIMRLVATEPPHLIILVVTIPTGDCLSVCEVLATDSQFALVPVILLVGRSDTMTIKHCKYLGVHYLLKSPDLWDQLCNVIGELLDIPIDLRGVVNVTTRTYEKSPGDASPVLLTIDDYPDVTR